MKYVYDRQYLSINKFQTIDHGVTSNITVDLHNHIYANVIHNCNGSILFLKYIQVHVGLPI